MAPSTTTEASTPDYKISFTAFHNIINNEPSPTASTRAVPCPSTEEPLWDAPVSGPEDVDRAVSAAKKAFRSWSRLSFDERAGYLLKFGDALEANRDEFADLLAKEAGKPPPAAAGEVGLAIWGTRVTPHFRLKETTLIDNEEQTVKVRYVPMGVGVGLVPWNYPIAISVAKLLSALLAGNTFILKPSEYAPYSGLKLAELGSKVFPPGVLQALSGEASLGPLFTAHPDVAKISFTGSVATGKRVMAACASTLKRVTLELGGNDAAIICDDVDIDSVAKNITMASFTHSGQVCMNVKRVYVHESIYDKFLAAMVEVTKSLKFGPHTEHDAFSGGIQNTMQYEKLQKTYAKIGQEGWKTAVGGEPPKGPKTGKGFYMPPTIVDNPPEDSDIVVSEPFGPIVPVLKWTSEEDVIERANATKMGLGGSVWSADEARARRLAEQLEAGTIWVNTHAALAPNIPMGGHKESGMGVEWGELSVQGWCNPQTYNVQHLPRSKA
ncbi:aldehyde dehydrogenase [Xylariaceae sp. FL0594]|nr:aldehyde dehydrogenase [Xylariaceae sp. FL0594]